MRRLALAAAVLAVLAALLEAGLRARAALDRERLHPLLGTPRFRGRAFAAERDPRGVRIVVVGDEWAWGQGLPAEHAWPALLAGTFARDGRASRVEVLNAAAPGDSVGAALARLESQLRAVQPTWLVVSFGVGEVRDALRVRAEERWWGRSVLVRAAADALDTEPQAPRSREQAAELARGARFEFGVAVAQLVERAWQRRVYVALLQPPWPPSLALGEESAPSAPDHVALDALGRELHAALCDELARVAHAADVVLIDARGALEGASGAFDERGDLTSLGAQQCAATIYAALRARIP